MLTGVIIPFGNGLNLGSECGTGGVEAVDSWMIFVTFETEVFEVAWRFVAWSGIIKPEAYGWSLLLLGWSVGRIPKRVGLICGDGLHILFWWSSCSM